MSSELATNENRDLIAELVLNNDFSRMAPESRVEYTIALCSHLGLSPVTRPFEFQTFQGKTVLYANKSCTDQLRSRNKISIQITGRDMVNDLCIVTARATDMFGRTDESTGVVSIAGKSGEMLANLMMKAETKAKRRVTLSLCGLGMLDESERDGAAVGFVDDRPAFDPSQTKVAKKSPMELVKAAADRAGVEITVASKIDSKPEVYGVERGREMHSYFDKHDLDADEIRTMLIEQGTNPEEVAGDISEWPYRLSGMIKGVIVDIRKARKAAKEAENADIAVES